MSKISVNTTLSQIYHLLLNIHYFMKILLLPFSMLYGIITDVRNYLYDKGFWKEFTFDKPIINVGNITVGGTGKTPHVEYLIRLLKDKYAIATLSRGYGRKTKGFILAKIGRAHV